MNPLEAWGQQATTWARSPARWLDGWRRRDGTRFDSGGLPLRTWLGQVAVSALGIGVAAAAVHSVLGVALASGAALGWLAVAAIAATAAVLLVMVVRETVRSFATTPRRRAHLIALLVSVATLVAAGQASAAATVALSGRTIDLWQAEQLYAWRLADSVPVLAIPRRLQWSQPVVDAVPGEHAIYVVFLVALVVPLLRMLLASYHLTGGNAADRAAPPSRPKSLSLTAFGVRLRRSSLLAALVTSAGFVVGGVTAGPRLGGIAVVVAVVGGVLLAALLWIAMSLATAVWAPISGGPWMQLVVAAGLVWIDTPVRQVLLSRVDGWGAPGKIVVTLGLWAVLTVLLLPVWVDPQLPESLLGLGLLVAFAGAGAPGRDRLLTSIGWTPGGFALGSALATAAVSLTGAYLAYLLSRSLARSANARLPVGGANDLRRELGGYAYVGLQVVTAAAGALLLLGSTNLDAPRALLTIGWHVADSLPGPDLTAGTGPIVDVTGPWAGSIVIAAVVMLAVVVVFPMIRAIQRWAKLKAGPPVLDRPLAEIPSALLADLDFVRGFLVSAAESGISADLADDLPEVERRLTLAEFDRAKLRDLLGEESPVYWAADNAIILATEAYQIMVRNLDRHALKWSPWPVREAGGPEAIEAIELYADAVDRWQMGADVVTEIESRVHGVEVREEAVESREHDVAGREYRVDAWERGVNAREQVLELHEAAALTRDRELGEREQAAADRDAALDARTQETEARERVLGPRELAVAARERNADLREQVVDDREQAAEERELRAAALEQSASSHDQRATVRHHELDARERWIEAREQNAEIREASVVAREQNAFTADVSLPETA
ncbi:MAG: hypothetical protein HOU81_16615 [Hamadaea sp.]|uniref:hypothetical protein n=1 Tax=Hamadaea sp. TaxID=2024425 RepID=UPI0018005B0D|nr:hypothetical protein [Hamadaea sp.]NUR72440.1 hypothetical protein [Hamadaea sp.]NUT19965.1 hypothetical protein [Hamadaea sp.]